MSEHYDKAGLELSEADKKKSLIDKITNAARGIKPSDVLPSVAVSAVLGGLAGVGRAKHELAALKHSEVVENLGSFTPEKLRLLAQKKVPNMELLEYYGKQSLPDGSTAHLAQVRKTTPGKEFTPKEEFNIKAKAALKDGAAFAAFDGTINTAMQFFKNWGKDPEQSKAAAESIELLKLAATNAHRRAELNAEISRRNLEKVAALSEDVRQELNKLIEADNVLSELPAEIRAKLLGYRP